MKPQELFLANGKSAGVWYCDSCHIVKRTKEEAEDCCQPRQCDSCGCEVDRFRITCSECHIAKMHARDLDAMEKAELVEGWDGWVWHPEVPGDHDGYFHHPDNLADTIAELDEDEEIQCREFAFCCKPRQLTVSIESICDRLDDNGWEGMTEHAKGVDELWDAIDKFNELNKDLFVVWEADYKRKVRL